MSDPDNTPSSPFGRGWIPAARDLGLPGEGEEVLALRSFEKLRTQGERVSAGAPLPPAGGVGGGHVASRPSAACIEGEQALPPTADTRPGEGRGLREGEVAGSPPFGGEARHDAFTPARQARFLHHLACLGSVRAAAAAVRVSAQAVYVCRRRSARFAAGWDAALVLARDHAEAVLAERALDGVEEAVFYHGEEVARRRRYDSRLLLAHLARLDRHAEGNAAGQRRAARFDELVALVAGAAPEGLAEPEPWSREAQGADPFLPPARAEHVARSADGMGPRAYRKARARAEAQWDGWQARAEALVDALAQGQGEQAVAAPDGAAGRDEAAAGSDAEEWDEAAGPTEFKSLTPPPEFLSVTLSTSSTTPPAQAENTPAESTSAGGAAGSPGRRWGETLRRVQNGACRLWRGGACHGGGGVGPRFCGPGGVACPLPSGRARFMGAVAGGPALVDLQQEASTVRHMAGYKDPTFQDRAAASRAAREKALKLLEKRSAPDSAAVAAKAAALAAKEAAAAQKAAERKAAIAQAKADKQAAREAAEAKKAPAKASLSEAEKKALRDARYAARKARRK